MLTAPTGDLGGLQHASNLNGHFPSHTQDVLIKTKLQFICLFIRVQVPACMWRSEDTLWELVLTLHQVGPGARTQVVKLGSRRLYHQLFLNPVSAVSCSMESSLDLGLALRILALDVSEHGWCYGRQEFILLNMLFPPCHWQVLQLPINE